MMNVKHILAAALCLGGMASVASANDGDVDIRSFEYLDVIETSDGSVWKGVIVEQTPNVSYKVVIAGGSVHVIKAEDVLKMSKQRNREFRGGGVGTGGAPMGTASPTGTGVGTVYEPRGGGLPPPYARSGLRFEPELAFMFPSGDIEDLETSFAPGVRLGYESLFGPVGVGGGAMTRFTYWMIPGDTGDAFWTLETHLYGRLALHLGRVNAFAGLSLGVDTNYLYDDGSTMSETTLGFGMNLQTGVEVAASPLMSVRFGFDYHPGTDSVVNAPMGEDPSVSYFALLLAANLHL